MKSRKNILKRQSGIALITVILIVSVLAAAALELNRSTRNDIYDAANLSDGIRLTYIAKSGFYGATALLANSRNDYETLRDDWAQAETFSAQSASLFPDGYFIVRIEDEKGKIPLNKLVDGGAVNPDIKEMLLRLLALPEFELGPQEGLEIVDSIIDWIDENDDISGMGAESSYYASLPAGYKAKNGPMDCIEELLMIKGISKEVFAGTGKKPGLRQCVTIHGTGAININTAPKPVLRALCAEVSAELADKMDEYRRSPGNDLSSVTWYKNVPGMGDITIKPELIEMVKSNYFTIYSTGMTEGMEQSVNGVVQRSPLKVLSWRLE
jgi:general secretion pathway protein K